MCKETISFTIPKDKEVLLKTAAYLQDLAGSGHLAVLKGLQSTPNTIKSPDGTEYKLDTNKWDADPVTEFNADTPEAMSDRIDEAAAGGHQPQGELDADSRPWDERIDSSAKTKTADGKWKLRRGVDKELVKKVLAEYVQWTTPEPAPAAPPVAEAPAPALKTFKDFKELVHDRIKAEKLIPTDLSTACTMAGSQAAMMPQIEKESPEMIDAIYNQLVTLWATRD